MSDIDIYEVIGKLKRSGVPCVIVTVVDRSGSAPQDPGAKLLVTLDGDITGTVGGGRLESVAIETAKEIFKTQKSTLKKYSLGEHGSSVDAIELGMMCGGSATLFYEYIGKQDSIFIFGAGHVGKALLHHLKMAEVLITMVDSREEMLDQVQGAEKKLIHDYGRLAQEISVPDKSYIVVCTHSHDLDFEILKAIYSSDWKPAYVGALASSRKAMVMKKKLFEECGKETDIGNLFMPVGLDIGGRSVDEIAVSIIAEIQGLKYGKTGLKHMKTERAKK
ncbi:MAG TPA: XdhC family protein [Spirochaetota bacterium]|nr:XdhC family protein [Spirochaetota bacterium]